VEPTANLLFFFSALGAFNGLVFSLYFMAFAKPKHHSNLFLGLLLLALSIRIGKSVFYYFNSELSLVFLQIGLTACAFIGPFLFLYAYANNNGAKSTQKMALVHLAIPLIFLMAGILKYDYTAYFEIWRGPLFRAIYTFWAFYVLATGWYLRKTLKKIVLRQSNWVANEKWLVGIYTGNLIICMVFWSVRYTSYIAGALSFSFILYLLALVLLFKSRFPWSPVVPISYGNTKMDADEANPLIHALNTLMQSDKPYTDANLKMADLAQSLGVTAHKLSQLLNDNIGKSFSEYINHYRIEEAKTLIQNQSALPLEAIG
jgi:AraC-like DNA-binding protein